MARRYLTDAQLEAELATMTEDSNDDFLDKLVMSDEVIDDSFDDAHYDPSTDEESSNSNGDMSDEDVPGPSCKHPKKYHRPKTFLNPTVTLPASNSTVAQVANNAPVILTANNAPIVQPVTPAANNPPVISSSNNPRDLSNLVWTDPVGNQLNFTFSAQNGMDPNVSGMLALADPVEYFQIFLTDDIINLMVLEINSYATQVLLSADAVPRSRLHEWVPTDLNEMKRFIGLIGWMGMIKVPRLTDYWSKHKLFSFPTPRSVMSRNSFELLLRFWHFADNEQAVLDNRLYKIENILEKFVFNFRSTFTPGEKICIDQTVVPWRG